MSLIDYKGDGNASTDSLMPLGTLHTVRGIIERRPGYRFFIVVREGGEWELEPNRRFMRYLEYAVTIEGVRTGFNRLEVVRIKRDGEDWPPGQSWTRWFNHWRNRRNSSK